jgi:ABC-type bacteriocin/lantibiotic exporter with double-glycine peptidase domain
MFMDRMVLLISHRFSTVRLADYIFVLEGGKILGAAPTTTSFTAAASMPSSLKFRQVFIDKKRLPKMGDC